MPLPPLPIQVQKKTIVLISGVVLGIVAIVMVNVYISQQRQLVEQQKQKELANMRANQAAVLVAKQDIPKGSVIAPAMLSAEIIPNKFVQPNAVTSLDRIAGLVTIAPISRGEQITLSKLASPNQSGTGGLASLTPAGKRAVSISVDNTSSLSGMIQPGNYVDVIAILPIPVKGPDGNVASQLGVIPLFQNVLILAIGSDTGGPREQESRYTTKAVAPSAGGGLITLALSPQEAGLIAFVQEQGRIRLVLRSPADAQTERIPPATWETLFQYIMPPQAQQPAEQKKAEDYVEVYRGMNKERVPLSK
ncbi:MAG: Flp pilus assembly protein CpaB [Candidatus Omnitrophica bacterium]|nr:Flp pilus assembly protein CpaB [Candidatus Omnitrophota bacterium]